MTTDALRAKTTDRAMKLTTKQISDGLYRVHADGRATDILIERGDPPRWGEPQEWWVTIETGDWPNQLFIAKGKTAAISTLAAIWTALK